jgi:hypothetical protein
MPQITVTVVRADTNQEYEVELPDDAKLDDLLPQLVQQLGLPLVGPDGNRISYQLSNKRTSQELKQNKTLGEYATKNGDLLLLTSTFVAGRQCINSRFKIQDVRALKTSESIMHLESCILDHFSYTDLFNSQK